MRVGAAGVAAVVPKVIAARVQLAGELMTREYGT